jgi:hypothetical protein
MIDDMTDFEWLIGDRISGVRFEDDSKAWLVSFQSGASLRIESMWRLIEEGVICSTSFDHGHCFGQAKDFDGKAALED